MPKWIMTIDVKEQWDMIKKESADLSDEQKFPKSKAYKKFIRVLKDASNKIEKIFGEEAKDDYYYIVEELEEADTVGDFNYLWEELYDWADSNRVWIKTIL